MTDLSLILLGALLVNNFVLAQFLGSGPFMGITKSYDTAFATGLATTFVLSLAAVSTHILYNGILLPLGLEYLRIILFIVVIGTRTAGASVFARIITGTPATARSVSAADNQ